MAVYESMSHASHYRRQWTTQLWQVDNIRDPPKIGAVFSAKHKFRLAARSKSSPNAFLTGRKVTRTMYTASSRLVARNKWPILNHCLEKTRAVFMMRPLALMGARWPHFHPADEIFLPQVDTSTGPPTGICAFTDTHRFTMYIIQYNREAADSAIKYPPESIEIPPPTLPLRGCCDQNYKWPTLLIRFDAIYELCLPPHASMPSKTCQC